MSLVNFRQRSGKHGLNVYLHNVHMAYNDEERTESASETRRVKNPDSMVSGDDEEEERRREEHERHRGESQNTGIQINDLSDQAMARLLSFEDDFSIRTSIR